MILEDASFLSLSESIEWSLARSNVVFVRPRGAHQYFWAGLGPSPNPSMPPLRDTSLAEGPQEEEPSVGRKRPTGVIGQCPGCGVSITSPTRGQLEADLTDHWIAKHG
jgi:hypothetical protein